MPKAVNEKIKKHLVEKGYLNAEQIAGIEDEFAGSDKSFPDFLYDRRHVDKKIILEALASGLNVQAVDLDAVKPSADSARLIPEKIMQRYKVIALKAEEESLTVAMTDPFNVEAIDDIRNITGKSVKPLIALESDILHSIESISSEDSGQNIEDIIEKELAGDDSDIALVNIDNEASLEKEELLRLATETPIVKFTHLVFQNAVRDHASDVLIEPLEHGLRVRYRIDGILHEVKKLPKEIHASIISRIKVISNLNIAEHRKPQDGRFRISYSGREVDFRVSIVPSSQGEKVCVRILDKEAAKLDINALGFEGANLASLKYYSKQPHGMILVCGPTGSGKTTTLYSMLKLVDDPSLCLVTVEDPIEFEIFGINQVAINTDVNLTFAAALRSILRQDPDIILIGEIRDAETLDVSVKAALTGHLVLSTLHTTSAVGSITRLLNMGVEPFLICSSVLMIASQRLARKLCTRCRKRTHIDEALCKKYGIQTKGKGAQIYEAAGCKHCFNQGYRGRICLIEILSLTPDIRKLVMEGASEMDVLAVARTAGMKTMRENGIAKVLEGLTTIDEVLRVTIGDQEITI